MWVRVPTGVLDRGDSRRDREIEVKKRLWIFDIRLRLGVE